MAKGRSRGGGYHIYIYNAPDIRMPHFAILGLHSIHLTHHEVRVLNTHFDHEGILARSNSAALITDALAKFKEKTPCPQILCGDFNSPKSSEAYLLLAKELKDVFRSGSDLCTSGARSTIHKWQGLSFKEAMGDGTVDLSEELEKSKDEDTRHIDWILWQNGPTQFQSTQLQPVRCRVVTDTLSNGRYPSDHFPLSATFLVSFTSVQSRL